MRAERLGQARELQCLEMKLEHRPLETVGRLRQRVADRGHDLLH
jgi:hypothetical protein